ncbi:glycerol-3-phosphate 1-O-acyltransferase PlsY [soil metagenome]
MRPLLVIVISYLVGSIPVGYLVVRAKEGDDIRQTGSGGTGATNVSRRAGKGAGVLTLILDALKGAVSVLFAKWVVGLDSSAQLPAPWLVAAAALAVLVGHIFPIWLKFRGGKGVATGVGIFLILMPAVVFVAVLIFVGVVMLTRYVSLGSIVATLAIPILVWLQNALIGPLPDFVPLMTVAVAGASLIVLAHRENIARLVQGRESKFA